MSGTVYISGPLQAAADLQEARARYEHLASVAEACGFSAYLPHTSTDPATHPTVSAATVFERDMHEMRRADVIVACIGAPSSGVGAELAFAFQAGQKVVALWGPEERPSRFLLGMLEAHPHAQLLLYHHEAEMDAQLRQALLA